MRDNITAVIRSSGERTTELCRYIVCQQLPEKNVFVINKAPSTEGTRAVYEIGLCEGRKWTLFIDADQLLLPDAVEFLYKLAESQSIPAFGVKGTVIDKLFLELRGMGCGPIMYYTDAFKHAINYIPDPYQSIRPDSYIINHMQKYHSYPWVREKKNTALHDYEQYYSDIYKKMFINSKKMEVKCRKMIDRWEKLAKKDKDYAVCLKGFTAGYNYTKPLAIDYTQNYGYTPEYQEKEQISNFEGEIEKLCLKSL
jgi:hypothetical protein